MVCEVKKSDGPWENSENIFLGFPKESKPSNVATPRFIGLLARDLLTYTSKSCHKKALGYPV